MGALLKEFDSEVVPGRPAVPGIPATPPLPAIFMRLFATPSPIDTAYRYRNASVYKTLQQILDQYGGSVPAGSTPVYGDDPETPGPDSVLLGYMIPGSIVMDRPSQFNGWSQLDTTVAPGWYGPIPNMQFVEFPDVPRIGNGYPEPGHNGPITGYIDLPTVDGMVRYSRSYYRDGPAGTWVPRSYTNPSFTRTGGSCRVMMLAEFPGSPGTPGVPGIPEIPDTERPVASIGWQAGADSVDERAADARLSFNALVIGGIVVGFTTGRDQLDAGFARLTHAL
ncbi:MAG: hypothetical protein ACREO0_04655, partial [Pseudoxanthomonas sp.]